MALESHFAERLTAIRNRGRSADQVFSEYGRLLAQIDTHIAAAHIDCDADEVAAWQAAREYVAKEIS